MAGSHNSARQGPVGQDSVPICQPKHQESNAQASLLLVRQDLVMGTMICEKGLDYIECGEVLS
jgi:hypothetical protein